MADHDKPAQGRTEGKPCVPNFHRAGATPTRRDCRVEGHVPVDDDPECVCCGKPLERGDRIARHVTRHIRTLGELTDPADVASVGEWDHAGLEEGAA